MNSAISVDADGRLFILVSALQKGFSLFGNKGSVWANAGHIAESGYSTTMCGTPMLSTNHARLAGVTEIGCQKCIELYLAKTNTK